MHTLRPASYLWIALLMVGISCAPSRFVKPLAKKEHAANLALGGPLIGFGNATIPIPFVTATYGYGLDSNTTGFAAFNITSALFQNAQLELGVSRRICTLNAGKIGVGVSPAFQLIYHDRHSKKIYPSLDLNSYWLYSNMRQNYFYLGMSNWFELSGKKAHDQIQNRHGTFIPMLGHVHTMKSKWDLISEIKIIAPGKSNENIVVDYKTPFGKKGAFGIYIGITRRF